MSYVPKRPMREHQQRAFEFCKNQRHTALLMRMRCVDRDTEYLSPEGWKKISEYTGGKVAQFNRDGSAEFVDPINYFVSDCAYFYHFYHKNGMDQMLSPGHRILGVSRSGVSKVIRSQWKTEVPVVAPKNKETDVWVETTPELFLSKGPEAIQIPTTFTIKTDSSLPLTDAEIRVQVAFHADGSYGGKDISTVTSSRKGGIRIKKDRKKERLRTLLIDAGIEYKETKSEDGFSVFSFYPPMVSKSYTHTWYQCSYEQLLIITDEILHWDGGHTNENRGGQFFSSRKEDIDFVQYAFSATGRRCSSKWGRGARPEEGVVTITGTGRTGKLVTMFPDAEIVPSPDGKMYCFEVPSTYLVFRRNGAVFCSGNTGKSKVALDKSAYLYNCGRIQGIAIIAPNGVHSKWVLEDVVKDIPDYIQYRAAVWRTGNTDSMEECEDLFSPGTFLRIVTMNVEAFQMKDSKAENFLKRFLNAMDVHLIMDESHSIGNPKAKRTEKLIKLGYRAAYKSILTGTAASNGPFSLYSQFNFLDENIFGQSYLSFQHTYGDMLPTNHPKVVAAMQRTGARFPPPIVNTDDKGRPIYKNLDMLKETIAPYTFTCTLEECTDLPPTIYESMYYELDPKQRKIYNDLATKARAEFEDDAVTVTHKLTLLLRLQQTLCGFLPSDDEDRLISIFDKPENNPRVKSLLTLLDSIQDEQVLIWCRFVPEIEMIAKILGDECVTYYGATSTEDRERAKHLFNSGKKKYLVGNTQTAGVGLDFSGSYVSVFYSNTFSYVNRDQAEARQQFIGQQKSICVFDFIAENTIDAKIVLALRNKKDVAEEFFHVSM